MIAAELRGGSRLSLDEALGWIGSRVDDLYGVGVGRLEDIWIDPGTGIPRWLLVKEGRFDGRTTLIPFEDASAGAGRVWIPYEQDVVRRAPEVEPGSPLTQQLESALRRHYAASAAAAVPHAGPPQAQAHAGAPQAPPMAPGGSAYQHAYPGPDPYYDQPPAHQQPYGSPRQMEYGAAPRYPQAPPQSSYAQPPLDLAPARARGFAAQAPSGRPAQSTPPRTVPPMRAAPPPPRPPAPIQHFPPPAPPAAAAPAPQSRFERQPPPAAPESRFERQPPPAAPVEPLVPRSAPAAPPQAASTEPGPGRPAGQPPLAAVQDDPALHERRAPEAAPDPGSAAPGDAGEPVAMPVVHGLDKPYRVEMQFEGELRISGELKGFRMTPSDEDPT